jgi:hypothetical protein
MQTRNSLTPTKSVPVSINGTMKYMTWIAKVLFYICVLTVVTKLITRFSAYMGYDFNYIFIIAIFLFFAYQGQLNQLMI